MKVRKTPPIVRTLRANRVTMPEIGDGTGGTVALIPGWGLPDPSEYIPTVVTNTVGWFRVTINNKDVTFFRGTPCEILEYTHGEPFGSGTATVKFPQITPFDDPAEDNAGGGSLPWLQTGKPLEIVLYNTAKAREKTVFEGFIVGFHSDMDGDANGEACITVEAQGSLYQADHILAQPEIVFEEQDLGELIPELLNKVPGRRYAKMKKKTTGVTTRSQGSWEPLLTGRIQDLLATATTSDGLNQWTIKMDPGRRPKLVLKDTETIDWTIYNGAPGVSINVSRDITQAPTQVYGRGVNKQGDGWANLRTPGFDPDVDPYPYASTATAINGSSSSTLREKINDRLRELGYKKVPSGDTWNTETTAAIEHWQRAQGETVTGVVKGQTWTSMFYRGDPDDLKNAFYAPLGSMSYAEPYLYDSTGKRTGKNPDYNPDRLRVERFHSYGEGASKAKAKTWAEAELERDRIAGWTDTITLKTDPVEASKFKILAGDNIQVRNWQGQGNKLFHVVEVSAQPAENQVTLTVDTRSRDMLTLDAIKERNRSAKNPARRPGLSRRNELQAGRPTMDAELVGHVNAACEAEKWSICRVPLGTEGDIVKTVFTADEATPFVVAFFNSKITPKQLVENVGDPFTEVSEGVNPFPGEADTADWLEAHGLIEVLGGPGQRAGFYPKQETDEGATPTGKHKDTSILLNYTSANPPFIWVAIYAEDPAMITGRLYLAPEDW